MQSSRYWSFEGNEIYQQNLRDTGGPVFQRISKHRRQEKKGKKKKRGKEKNTLDFEKEERTNACGISGRNGGIARESRENSDIWWD